MSQNHTEEEIRKKEARKLSNKKYQEKLKAERKHNFEQENHITKQENQNVEQETSVDEPEVFESEQDEPDNYVLDKKTYLYLLEKAKKAEELLKTPEETRPKANPEAPKEPIPTPTGNFFFQQVKQNLLATAASLLPILVIQGAIHGGKYLMSSTNKQDVIHTTTHAKDLSPQPTLTFELPVVNSL